MTKIVVTMSILCEDERIAHKVVSEFFPSTEDIAMTEGVEGVKLSWLADSTMTIRLLAEEG